MIGSIFLTFSLHSEQPTLACLDKVIPCTHYATICYRSLSTFIVLSCHFPTEKNNFHLPCNIIFKKWENTNSGSRPAELSPTHLALVTDAGPLDSGRDSVHIRHSKGLTEKQRDRKFTVLSAQNKETQNLQKKSILLGLFSAIMIIGVDVTITKNPFHKNL